MRTSGESTHTLGLSQDDIATLAISRRGITLATGRPARCEGP